MTAGLVGAVDRAPFAKLGAGGLTVVVDIVAEGCDQGCKAVQRCQAGYRQLPVSLRARLPAQSLGARHSCIASSHAGQKQGACSFCH